MKYCIKCGNPMQDDMLFCPKCGTKAATPEAEYPTIKPGSPYRSQRIDPIISDSRKVKSSKPKKNKNKIAAVVFFVLAVIYAVYGVAIHQLFAMTAFCTILGAMFLVLSKSAKGSKYILGKDKGIGKSGFIAICILSAFIIFIVLMTIIPAPEGSSNQEIIENDAIENENVSNREETSDKDVDANQAGALFADIITDSNLRDNFIFACEVTGIDVKKVKNLEQVEDWIGGPRYSFLYENAALRLYCNMDSTVNTIKLGTDTDIYKQGFEPYQIDDYLVSSEMSSSLRMLVEDLVKGQLNYPKTADFPWLDWSYGRDHNLYSVSSKVSAENAFGVEEEIPFRAIYYVDDDTTTLKYFEMKGEALINKMDSASVPERTPVTIDSPSSLGDNIVLVDGQLGTYGKEIIIDGDTYINYHVPSGSYTLTSNVNWCVVYISSDEYYKNSDGYTENDIIAQYTFNSNGESAEIIVHEGEHLELTVNAEVTLTPAK